MADIAELAIRVETLELQQANRDLERTADRAKKADSATVKFGKAAGVAFAAVGAAAVAAAAGVAAIYAKQSQLIDQNAKLAQSLGTTYEGLANAQRAAELSGVSMSGLEQATKDLTRRLSQAASGAGPAADALARLGLSAEDLQALPLDQRIATINGRIREFIPAAEQAAVAGQLFGEEGSLAISRLSPETIAQAAREVELFGLNLSDIDAAKVEMANDAFSTFGLLTDGIAKQLTVQLAPIVKAVADEFLAAAEEAGGLGNIVQDVVDAAVPAIGFVVSAADGVSRAFSIAADTIVGTFATAEYWVNIIGAEIMEVLSLIPGVDLSLNVESMRQSAAIAMGVANEAAAEIKKSLSEPLAGAVFEDFVARARERAEQEAAAVVAGRSTPGGGFGGGFTGITGTGAAATAAGGTSAEDDRAAREEERRRAQTQRELQIIMDQMRTEEQIIQDSYERRRAIVEQATIDDGVNRTALLEKLEMERNEKMAALERERITAVLSMNEELFGGLSGLAQAYAGEQSTLYKAMFAVEKGFAVAKALINAPQAFSDAYTAVVGIPIVGPILAPIAGATAAAAQVAQAGAIRSVNPSFEGGGFTGYGARSGGVDGKGGFPAILHPNETVVDHAQGQSLGGTVVNINNAPSGTTVNRSQDADGRDVIDVMIADMRSDGPASRQMRQTFGLSRRGS